MRQNGRRDWENPPLFCWTVPPLEYCWFPLPLPLNCGGGNLFVEKAASEVEAGYEDGYVTAGLSIPVSGDSLV